MKRIMSLTEVALAGLAVTLPGIALGDVPYRGLYAFHTGTVGACPGLDWHVNVERDGKVTGMVGWDGMAHVAKLEGTVQANGDFSVHATEVTGSKTATVFGRAAGAALTMTSSGTGGPCDGKTLQGPRATGEKDGG